MNFSLFYFAQDATSGKAADRYRLLIEGAKFADTNGFEAVWTPERHFHNFGGLYPNPAVTAAALAMVTERISLRAGSAVIPLQHILRTAEDWSVVDNLSGGRVGISLAPGWNEQDFVLRPDAFADRHVSTIDAIRSLRALWSGQPFIDASRDEPRELRMFPQPVQPELPMWLTCASRPDTFQAAGRSGVGVLTHLMSQSVDDLTERIAEYSAARAEAGFKGPGSVVLMLHTFLGDDGDGAVAQAQGPLEDYLISAMSLFRAGTETAERATARLAVRSARNRYLKSDGLFGSVEDAAERVARFRSIGVTEIACLIDFGIETNVVLDALPALARLRDADANIGELVS